MADGLHKIKTHWKGAQKRNFHGPLLRRQRNFKRNFLRRIMQVDYLRAGNGQVDQEETMKRQDYLNWDEYFMGIALLSAQRSKDSNTQVGACIVDQDNKILSVGYNGMPTGCDDDKMPWEREGDFLDTKYPYVCHAELNAILNYNGGSLKGARVYVTLFPCNECTKAIIQSGIKEVIYLSDKYADTESTRAAKRMFDLTKVVYKPYQMSGKNMVLSL